MLLHTIIDPMAVMEQSAPPVCEYRRLSPFCTCEWTGQGREKRLTRIVSTDLADYLRFSAGGCWLSVEDNGKLMPKNVPADSEINGMSRY